jgi:hypothetical protein
MGELLPTNVSHMLSTANTSTVACYNPEREVTKGLAIASVVYSWVGLPLVLCFLFPIAIGCHKNPFALCCLLALAIVFSMMTLVTSIAALVMGIKIAVCAGKSIMLSVRCIHMHCLSVANIAQTDVCTSFKYTIIALIVHKFAGICMYVEPGSCDCDAYEQATDKASAIAIAVFGGLAVLGGIGGGRHHYVSRSAAKRSQPVRDDATA